MSKALPHQHAWFPEAVAMPQARMMKKRKAMVDRQLAARGIHDARVLAAMGEVPREEFVLPELRNSAYLDCALPIDEHQTISQPYIVARMAELAEIGPDDILLEVGAGSGYAAAVFGRLARRVIAVERIESLAETAARRIAALGYTNVEIIHSDGCQGWAPSAPYDAIIVSAGGSSVPPALKDQLKIGGRLIIPLQRDFDQILTRIRRTGDSTFTEEGYDPVAFVPLVADEP
jgi:protein-L-isoaspartate(D-aspartate) O-methyltransferase